MHKLLGACEFLTRQLQAGRKRAARGFAMRTKVRKGRKRGLEQCPCLQAQTLRMVNLHERKKKGHDQAAPVPQAACRRQPCPRPSLDGSVRTLEGSPSCLSVSDTKSKFRDAEAKSQGSIAGHSFHSPLGSPLLFLRLAARVPSPDCPCPLLQGRDVQEMSSER